MPEFTVEIKVDDEFIGDVFITAIEGGVNYWARICAYKHHVDTGRSIDEICALILDDEDETPGVKPYTVNFKTIVDGITRILNSDLVCDAVKKDIVTALKENDASAIDANDADCIVQIGLFGKLVYG